MRRKITAVASAVAVAMAAVIAPTQLASARETTKTTVYPQTCYAVPSKLARPESKSGQNVTVKVTSTENVEVGSLVKATMTVVPDLSDVSNLPHKAHITNNARIKADYQLPEGMKLVSKSLDNLAKSNVTGLDVFTVNENGEPDDNGKILRIAASNNATVGNSPNASKTGTGNANYAVSNDEISWHLPTLNLVFRAEKTGEFSFGTRSKNGAEKANENPKAYITFNAVTRVPVFGIIHVPTYCTPRKNAGSPLDEGAKHLFTWKVREKQPAQATSITIDTTDVQAGHSAVTASLTPSDAEGTVEFTGGDKPASASVIDGKASVQMRFKNAGSVDVKATFTPTDTESFKPSETSATLKVGAKPASVFLYAPTPVNKDSDVTVTATVTGATGSMTFTLDGAEPQTVPLKDGAAQATINVGDKLGNRTIKAEFVPAAGSPVGAGSTSDTILVKENTGSSLTLQGPTTAVIPGSKYTFTATVSPKKDTSEAPGTVAFTVGGVTKYVDVTVPGNKATAEMIVDNPGPNRISAEYFPASGSGQTNAVSAISVLAKETDLAQITATPPANLTPLTASPMTVTVTTASGALAQGKIIASVHGRTTEAQLSDGSADVDITVADTAETPVVLKYVPAEDSLLPPASTTVQVTATANNTDTGALNVALINIDAPKEADADKAFTVNLTVTNGETDSSDGINGYATVSANNVEFQEGGQPARVPVVNGKAAFDMTFKGGGEQPIQVAFFDASGTKLTAQSTSVLIKGGIVNEPSTAADGGGGFFAKIIEFFAGLFKGGDAGSSGGSSNNGNNPDDSANQPADK